MPTPVVAAKSLTRRIVVPASAASLSSASTSTAPGQPRLDQSGSPRALIDAVSITINPGDRIGLSGASGSGKSTLLRCLAMLDPTDGEVYFLGNKIEPPDLPGYRRQVIYLHQRPAFIGGTVRENLQTAFAYESSAGNYDEARVLDWLKLLSRPASLLDQATESLSGGEQQLIALLRAIQINPKVLLLDEPSASLDAESTAKFEEMVNHWFENEDDKSGNDLERAFVWISHDASQLQRMTTRSLTMEMGRLNL